MKQTLSITNMIGILLVVVAIVSAGGMFYIANEYSRITETTVFTAADITDVILVQNNATGEVTISVSIEVSNPSSLGITLYNAECPIKLAAIGAEIQNSDKYVGQAVMDESNDTVAAESVGSIQASNTLDANSFYMTRYVDALNGGNMLTAYVTGKIMFRITEYPDVQQPLYVYFFEEVTVQYVRE